VVDTIDVVTIVGINGHLLESRLERTDERRGDAGERGGRGDGRGVGVGDRACHTCVETRVICFVLHKILPVVRNGREGEEEGDVFANKMHHSVSQHTISFSFTSATTLRYPATSC